MSRCEIIVRVVLTRAHLTRKMLRVSAHLSPSLLPSSSPLENYKSPQPSYLLAPRKEYGAVSSDGMGRGGAMDGCGRCMKISLIGINVIGFVGGLIALSLALWVLAERSFPSRLLANNMFIGGVCVVAATGAVVLLLSLLGCVGAAREVKCMLLAYYITVLIVVVTMLVGGVLLLVFRAKAEESLERELRAAIPYYGNRHDYTSAWDDTQSLLECCGVRSYRDWDNEIPQSCCKEVYPGKRQECRQNPNPTNLYVDGCMHKSLVFLQQNASVVGAAGIVVSLLMIFGLVFSCGLFMKIE